MFVATQFYKIGKFERELGLYMGTNGRAVANSGVKCPCCLTNSSSNNFSSTIVQQRGLARLQSYHTITYAKQRMGGVRVARGIPVERYSDQLK